MRIDVRKIGAVLYEASLNGEVLCQSSTPLRSAARILMKRGVDPKTELRMVRLGSDKTLVRARLGTVAELSVLEGGLAGSGGTVSLRKQVGG